jgi:hypothetical protein
MTRAIVCDGAGNCPNAIHELDPNLVEQKARHHRWTYGIDASGDRWDYCPDHPHPDATPDGTRGETDASATRS